MTAETPMNWLRYKGVTYKTVPGEPALNALLRQGAPVQFSCRKGSCRSCMLQATSGDPGNQSRQTLSEDMQALGFFLPCCATDVRAVDAVDPDLSLCSNEAMVADKQSLPGGIIRLQLELGSTLDWKAGQQIELANPQGDTRSYSIVSRTDDYFLELHIRHIQGGAVSGWVAETLNVGDMVRFFGPSGNFTYDGTVSNQQLLLIGTGTAGGVLLGIARDALARGHTAPIHIYHGAATEAELYLGDDLDRLAKDHENVWVHCGASREGAKARITDIAFSDHPELSQTTVYLCGSPEMVDMARVQAVMKGAEFSRLFSDPFDVPGLIPPQDAAKLAALSTMPDLWAALEDGEKLSAILRAFYDVVYTDERLSPFFHRVTKQRAIDKQYNFLRSIMLGSRDYFGEKPFNAHHWMVISNDLFDYRERLLMNIARQHDLPEPMVRKWAGLHELFRREIVKSTARGVMRAGVEVDLEGYTREIVDVGTVCDGCAGEVNPGDTVQLHRRTGELFCDGCEGRIPE